MPAEDLEAGEDGNPDWTLGDHLRGTACARRISSNEWIAWAKGQRPQAAWFSVSWREQGLEICTHRIQSEHGFLPFENQVGPSRSPFFLGDSATRRPEPWLCFSRDSAPSHPWVYEPLRATCFLQNLVSKTIAHTQGIQRRHRAILVARVSRPKRSAGSRRATKFVSLPGRVRAW